MSSAPMAELVSCCLYLFLLLAKNRFVLNYLAGRLSYSQVLGHCISWSRDIENIVKLSSLQIPGCSFQVSQCGPYRAGRGGKYVGGGGQTSGHRDSWKEGGRSWRLLVGLQEELLAGGQEEQDAGCQEEGMTVSRWGLLNGGGGREGFCLPAGPETW